MGAQDNTEKVLRDIHVLFSKAEPYNGSKRDIIVNKDEVMDLLKELNDCMYEMMEEHELSQRKKDKANREMKKQGDDIIFEATRKAEDIYAASIMYTDNALNSIQDIIAEANREIERIYTDSKEKLEEEKHIVKTNQSELKSQLESLIDTQKYIRLIEDENQRLQMAKDKGTPTSTGTKSSYAGVQPEIKINKEYFIQNGIPFEDDGDEEEASREEKLSDEEIATLSQDLDKEYFEWKEDEKEGKTGEEKKSFSLLGKIIDKQN